MSSVFHSSIGPMHNFHQTLPADCRCLHVTVIGSGSGLSLYFRGQERNTSFVMPLFEGIQSVCTGNSRYSLSTWWTGGVSLHSFEWLPTAYPAGHYALRFVYRRPYDGELPKLTTYCWSVVSQCCWTRTCPWPPVGPTLLAHTDIAFCMWSIVSLMRGSPHVPLPVVPTTSGVGSSCKCLVLLCTQYAT
jgi:hypothetical protein